MTTTEYLDEPETLPQEIIDWQPTHKAPVLGAATPASARVGALAVGALAVATLAIGAIFVGRLAIGRLSIGKARVKSLDVDHLTVRIQLRHRAVGREATTSLTSTLPRVALE